MITDENGIQYDIRVGDYVETVGGLIGYVEDICFKNEYGEFLHFKTTNALTEVTYHSLKIPFARCFKRIGNYDFTRSKPQKPKIKPIKIIPKYKKVQARILKTDVKFPCGYYEAKIEETTILDGYEEIPQIVILNKINEIVSRLNDLEE